MKTEKLMSGFRILHRQTINGGSITCLADKSIEGEDENGRYEFVCGMNSEIQVCERGRRREGWLNGLSGGCRILVLKSFVRI